MARRKSMELTTEQDKFVRMEANGYLSPEIIKELWGLTREDGKAYHNAECRLSNWRRHPKYQETWKDEVQRQCLPMMSEALRRIRTQMQKDDQWLGNKAANDLLAFGKSRIFGEEDRAVTVKVEGMPELGSPDDGESGMQD